MPKRKRSVQEIEGAGRMTRSKARKLSNQPPNAATAPAADTTSSVPPPRIIITTSNGHTINTAHWLSTTTRTSFSASRLSFLDLPPETRNHIYQYISASFGNGRLRIEPGIIQGHLHPPPYLAQTCWAIRREMLNMVYNPRTFVGEEKELMLCLKPLRADTLRAVGAVVLLKNVVLDGHENPSSMKRFGNGAHMLWKLMMEAEMRDTLRPS